MNKRYCWMLAAGVVANYANAEDFVINFEQFPIGTVITDQYLPWAAFSSSSGNENYVVNSPVGTGGKVLASGSSGTPNYLQDTYIDFGTPLVWLNLAAYLPQPASGLICTFQIFENGIHTGTEPFIRNGGQAYGRDFLDYHNITRLEIVNIQQAVTWDNFVLTVPEPSTLFALSICALSLVRLRRNKTNA